MSGRSPSQRENSAEIEKEEFAGENQIRANVYSLLATLLTSPPSAETLELLSRIEEANSDSGEMAAAWQALRRAAQKASVESVDTEYHKLFIGVGHGEMLPYGSWYTSGLIMDKPLALVRRDLAALGLERQPRVRDSEDHLGALCEAMAIIISSEDDSTLEGQKTFFENHLVPWAPKFFIDLQQTKSASFYLAVGRLGEEFMKFEEQYLALES
ncbi:MAG: molecular chaperone TorD family protein [Deltaproteobacteria bacterium]|jgi:TorA maturation chaperone TorD